MTGSWNSRSGTSFVKKAMMKSYTNFEQLLSLQEKLIWQQDGTPPHYETTVCNFVKKTFEEWIDRRGTSFPRPHAMYGAL